MLIELSVEEINTAIKGLAELPFKISCNLIMSMQNQANSILVKEQQEAARAAEELKKQAEAPVDTAAPVIPVPDAADVAQTSTPVTT
jgi:hypothetical protein